MKVSSNTAAAQAAVSGFNQINTDAGGQQVTLASSNISSMLNGATVANQILSHISELTSSVKSQASGVTALAAAIEDRDNRDAVNLVGSL